MKEDGDKRRPRINEVKGIYMATHGSPTPLGRQIRYAHFLWHLQQTQTIPTLSSSVFSVKMACVVLYLNTRAIHNKTRARVLKVGLQVKMSGRQEFWKECEREEAGGAPWPHSSLRK